MEASLLAAIVQMDSQHVARRLLLVYSLIRYLLVYFKKCSFLIPPTTKGLGWEGLYVLTCTGSRILTVCIVDPKSLSILDLFNFSDLSPLNAFRFHFGIEPFWFDNRPMETNDNDVPTRMLSQNTRARNQTAHQDAMSKLTRNQNSSDPFGKSSGECP